MGGEHDDLTSGCSGGEEVLVDVGGKDATNEFLDVGHSDDAEEILEGLLVGNADPAEFQVKDTSAGTNVATTISQDSGSNSLIYLVLAAIVAAGAFYYLQITK